ncbi:MAG: ABC transporter permease [Lachnospiraceae bacterium]|nr:ABC transporter permease [Lachnospiraceae bacterium]
MDTLREYIESAIKNIRSNRMRTLLTMLGIIIGIAAVVAIITLGNGMTEYVGKQFSSTGASTISVYLDSTKTEQFLTTDDANAVVEQFPGIIGTSYCLYYAATATSRKGSFDIDAQFVSNYQYLSEGTKLLHGRNFTAEEMESNARVCTLKVSDAKKLCGTENPVGMTLQINVDNQIADFEIVGVFEDLGEMISKMYEMLGMPPSVKMPYTTAESAFSLGINKETSMDIYVEKGSRAVPTGKVIKFLEIYKGLRGTNALFYYDSAGDTDEINQVMGIITTFMSFVAAISLLVGGIGVMNIMLVSVTERTREIGIRKSIGARTGSILIQFLAESSIISLLGGVIGVLLGLLIAAIVCHLINFKFIVTPSSVLLSAVFSSGIGVFFGIYPARKAARLKPVDALNRRS